MNKVSYIDVEIVRKAVKALLKFSRGEDKNSLLEEDELLYLVRKNSPRQSACMPNSEWQRTSIGVCSFFAGSELLVSVCAC